MSLRLPVLLAAALASAAEGAGRRLDLAVVGDFGAQPADIRAVIGSAGDAIWQHCPNTTWQTPGFAIFRRAEGPITGYDHRSDGRIAIGLSSEKTYWSQYAFQFGHEFVHALAGHANDWRKPWIRQRKANLWLEESLCETGSLFALRAMAKSWQASPPYPHWRDYSKSLGQYADDRLAETERSLPAGFDFRRWLAANEASMRANSVIREKNNVVARQLLPLFERTPSGWEAVTYLNLGARREPDLTLAQHLADWRAAAPAAQRAFITDLARELGVRL